MQMTFKQKKMKEEDYSDVLMAFYDSLDENFS